MRTIILTLLITSTLFQSCKGQAKPASKEFFNKDFNWKIEIPEGFKSLLNSRAITKPQYDEKLQLLNSLFNINTPSKPIGFAANT
jgi:hypothetical protein